MFVDKQRQYQWQFYGIHKVVSQRMFLSILFLSTAFYYIVSKFNNLHTN